MFILTTIEDLVQIPPHGIGEGYKVTREDLEDRINAKYCNKVVPKIGLCIAMYDLLKASDGLIGHDTGNINVNVHFRMVVFRPFKTEIISGIISRCTSQGIHISTRFFDDIFVPEHMLFEGAEYNEKEEAWLWVDEGQEYWFDPGEVVNIRVESEKWVDQALPPQKVVKPGDPEPEPSLTGRVSYSIESVDLEESTGGEAASSIDTLREVAKQNREGNHGKPAAQRERDLTRVKAETRAWFVIKNAPFSDPEKIVEEAKK